MGTLKRQSAHLHRNRDSDSKETYHCNDLNPNKTLASLGPVSLELGLEQGTCFRGWKYGTQRREAYALSDPAGRLGAAPSVECAVRRLVLGELSIQRCCTFDHAGVGDYSVPQPRGNQNRAG